MEQPLFGVQAGVVVSARNEAAGLGLQELLRAGWSRRRPFHLIKEQSRSFRWAEGISYISACPTDGSPLAFPSRVLSASGMSGRNGVGMTNPPALIETGATSGVASLAGADRLDPVPLPQDQHERRLGSALTGVDTAHPPVTAWLSAQRPAME